jgi:hypothetical protein
MKSQEEATITSDAPSNVVSPVDTVCKPWKPTCWLTSYHGSFISRRPVNKGSGSEDWISVVEYTTLYSERRGKKLMAPVMIMLIMMWLAVLAVGIVEGIEFVLERCGWMGDGEDDCLCERCDEEKLVLHGRAEPRCWDCSLADDRDEGCVSIKV